jgi:hypothetical protein
MGRKPGEKQQEESVASRNPIRDTDHVPTALRCAKNVRRGFWHTHDCACQGMLIRIMGGRWPDFDRFEVSSCVRLPGLLDFLLLP